MGNLGERTPRPDGLELTVVVVAGRRKDRARRAVESVLRQQVTGPFEVIVVDLDVTPESRSLAGSDSRVRIVPMPPTTIFGEARAHAVRLAGAPVIAFLEEHCVAHPGWAAALLSAHRGPWACVGSAVSSMNPGVGWSDAVYLLGYSQWIPPVASGEVPAAAAHNSSYKTDCLQPLVDRLPLLLLLEPLLQAELLRQGHRIYLEPAAGFDHQNETGMRSLRAFYWWNRCLGRVRWQGLPKLGFRKIAYTCLSPMAPWVRALRDLLRLTRRNRPVALRYLNHLPRILVLHSIATLGLVAGAWAGQPSDDLRFTDFELREDTER
jgi:glycosyltransferase involved in cell wall biosynthesis